MKKRPFPVVALLFVASIAIFLFFVKKQSPKVSILNISPSYNIDQMWGAEAKDMFPAITSPRYATLKRETNFLKDDSIVFLYKQGETSYVYPANIMSFHHLVNDTVEGTPLLISFCLLTDTGLVYSRQLDDKELNFGVLGTLYYGNLVMYDKETNSYWLQLTGDSFKGAFSGKSLKVITPLTKTYWVKVKNLDNLKVLLPEKDLSFYDDFYNTRKTSTIGLQALKVKKAPDTRLLEFTEGFGLRGKTETKFYPKNLLDNNLFIRDRFDGRDIVISKGPFDEISVSGAGSDAQLIPTYWFSWAAFYPSTKIY